MENNTQIDTTARLTKALRWAGTSAVVLAAVVFMLQGLNSMSSFERFLSFAGMTAALAAFGVYAGSKMKEAKSARTLLGLAGAATPVLFSQLGAMVYAFEQGTASGSLPSALIVNAPNLAALGGALVGTVLVMTPVLYLGFGAFFRARAKELALVMMAASALLLIPTRAADLTAILIAVQAAGLTYFIISARKKPAGEMESLVAGLLPLIPAAIMLGRQAFYGGSHLFTASIFLLGACLFHEILPYLLPADAKIRTARTIGLGSAGFAWAFFVFGLLDRIVLPHDLDLMLAFYPVAIGMLFLPNAPRGFARVMSLVIPVASIFSAWSFGAALVFIGIGLLTAILGFSKRNQPVFESGLVTAALGTVYYICMSVHLIYAMPWLSLAISGTAVIMAAAWLEKNRSKLGQWRASYSSHFIR